MISEPPVSVGGSQEILMRQAETDSVLTGAICLGKLTLTRVVKTADLFPLPQLLLARTINL